MIICVSVIVFYFIEGDFEQQHIMQANDAWEKADNAKAELQTRISDKKHISANDIDNVLYLYQAAKDLGPRNDSTKWTLIQTFSFTHEYLSTIGFGQLVPKTVAGQ